MVPPVISYRSVSDVNLVLAHQLLLNLLGQLTIMHVDYSSYLKDLLRVHVLPESPHYGLVKQQVTFIVHLLHNSKH